MNFCTEAIPEPLGLPCPTKCILMVPYKSPSYTYTIPLKKLCSAYAWLKKYDLLAKKKLLWSPGDKINCTPRQLCTLPVSRTCTNWGWQLKGSNCYCIKKQIEPFCTHLSQYTTKLPCCRHLFQSLGSLCFNIINRNGHYHD